MSGFLAQYGDWLAIGAMALATYFCRVSGVIGMSHIRITPRLERGLQALPGAIIVSTVLPGAFTAGPSAIAGVLAGLGIMALWRQEVFALVAGLAVVALARHFGF